MSYLRLFPSEHRLLELAHHADFPITREDMVALAEQKGFSASTVLFLRIFDPEDVFESVVDFINRCEEVKLLLKEERQSPKELLRSPQE